MSAQIRVTVEDLATGDTESTEIADDYILIAAGSCYLAHVNDYPMKGTAVLTVKGRLGRGAREDSNDG